jgi:hypothetical protein
MGRHAKARRYQRRSTGNSQAMRPVQKTKMRRYRNRWYGYFEGEHVCDAPSWKVCRNRLSTHYTFVLLEKFINERKNAGK